MRMGLFMAIKPKKSTSSTTSTSALSATYVNTSVTTPTASSMTAFANAISIDDSSRNDSSAIGASSTSKNPELLQSKNKTERETPVQNKIKQEINVLKGRIVKFSQLNDSGLSNSDNMKQSEAECKNLKEK